ncbi:MAG: alanine--tRNA ligase [Oscillospiraceae bacterium]
MKWMGLNELREAYLTFFESKAHLRAKSFPLVPVNDNSLLLINAGMAPLKPYFTGQETPPRKRMTTCQKCIRTGDIENVGKTARHGTFFEMLGNFSFGDYFKTDATAWAWEFVTKVLEIPQERLFVTVFEDDDEAEKIWNEKIGVPMEKIFRMGKDDNFWEAGIDGPCGPCSEIYYDRGEEFGCGKPDCTIGCDCDRYMEFWNLVFTQFERHEDGTYTPLAQKNIDTGMGLERLAAMMQGVTSIFDVDTIKAIRDHVCAISGAEYGKDAKKDISIRVITDHIRSVTFMASDGVLPSNEGRGYVMRRLLRRAVRHGKLLGIDGLFLKDLVKTVVDCSKHEYNELEEKYSYLVKLLTNEEKNFNETIDRGIHILNSYIAKLQESGETVLDGVSCFTLSDTYGFPIDLTREMLEEKGLSCDEAGFRAAMDEQREKARAARGGSKYMGADETVFHRIPKEFETAFVGYQPLEAEAALAFIAKDDELAENAGAGDEVYLIFPVTPFYAESGGQAGDTGLISTVSGTCEILDTVKVIGGKTALKARVTAGAVAVGQTAKLSVDRRRRLSTMRNHSCAHLLQAALREVLGEHVHQAGQLVDAARLRFDFSHFSAMTADELDRVTGIVNRNILDALEIDIREMAIDEAKHLGAMALFGEKYGEVVRVVTMGGAERASVEFCGGTHLDNTSKIGLFKIIGESSVAAGVRRIEAVTGEGVLELIDEMNATISRSAETLKLGNPKELVSRCAAVMEETKALTREIDTLVGEIAKAQEKALVSAACVVGTVRVAAAVVEIKPDVLKKMAENIKAAHPNTVAVLAGISDGKGNLCVACGKDAAAAGVHAGKLASALAALTGGKGGGRPDYAMAGIGEISKASDAIVAANDAVLKMLD